jgi:hypothetical protein
MSIINVIEVYQEGNVWYVKYLENDVEIVSEPFITEENAITYSLNLKSI